MKTIYISQGNIPSKWAHTFQSMKMAEALSNRVKSLELLTSGGVVTSNLPSVNLAEWYGIPCSFNVTRLPVHLSLKESLFSEYRNPRFDRIAAIYSRLKSPDLVFTRSPYAGNLSTKLGLDTIIETHIRSDHSEFNHILNISHSRHLRKIVTVTNHLQNQYVEAGIPEEKVLVWPDAVDLSNFRDTASKQSLRSVLGLPAKAKIATYCGHLYDSKGVPGVIEAARKLPSVLFCLVGGWQKDIERCQRQAEGIENIRFLGFVSNKQVPKYLTASDFLLLPNSMNHELAYSTSPLKLFEYMAARRPVIASDIPALKGFLRHRENAFLVKPDSSVAIISALKVLISDSALVDSIVEQAWQEVQKFTWSNRTKDILNSIDAS